LYADIGTEKQLGNRRYTTIPYIDVERAMQIERKELKPTEPGDWNWLFTVCYLTLWKENPRYATYHEFVKTIAFPEYIQEIEQVSTFLYDTIVDSQELQMKAEEEILDDLQAARFAALQEFHRRIIAPYENMKMSLPTQDDPYKRLGILK
jgi:hypothetical protein